MCFVFVVVFFPESLARVDFLECGEGLQHIFTPSPMTVAYVFPLIHRLDDEEPSCLEWWHTFISSQHLLCLGGCSFMSSAFMLFADQSYIGPRDDSCFLKRRQGSSVFRPDQRQKLASVRFWTRKQHNVSSSQWKSTLRGRFGIKYRTCVSAVG